MSAAATDRSPQRIRKRHPASRAVEAAGGRDAVQNVYGQREFGGDGSLGHAQGRGAGLADCGGGTECREDGAQGGRGSRGDMQRHGGSPLIRQAQWREGGGGRRCQLSGSEERGVWICRQDVACRMSPRRQDLGPRAPTLRLVCGVYTTRVQMVFRLAVLNMKSKAIFGRRNERFIPILCRGPSMTSDCFVGAVGRFSSAFFTRSCQAETVLWFMPRECASGQRVPG